MSAALVLAGCAPADPHAVAEAADRAMGAGVYAWLADHDPSALVVVGLDQATVRTVAPDATVRVARTIRTGCRAALVGHALLAVRTRRGSAARDLAQDCGFALFHDDETLVIAPR